MSDLGEASTSTPNPPPPQDVVQQQQQQQQPQQGQLPPQPAAAAAAQPAAPNVNAAGENLQCQWQNCGERCASPEALYVRSSSPSKPCFPISLCPYCPIARLPGL